MKKHGRQNALLIGALFVVLVCLFLVSITLICAVDDTLGREEVLVFEVKSDGKTVAIDGWRDEATNKWYAFLPSTAQEVKVLSQKGNTLCLNGEKCEAFVDADLIDFEKEYKYSSFKKDELLCESTVVFMRSENIPSVFIDTASDSMDYIHMSKNNSEKAEYLIFEEGKPCTAGIIKEMSGRGNTSWSYDKKGYSLIFSEPVSILGFEKSEKYVLLANHDSNLLSNSIAFHLEKEIGVKNVPQGRHIDLYLNGEYVGNYMLCEPIYIGENGIPITDLNEITFKANPGVEKKELTKYNDKHGDAKGFLWKREPDVITGGYLIERDVPEYYKEDDCGFILSSGDHYVIKSPAYASSKQVDYIHQYVQEAYDAIAAEDGYNPTTKKHYSEYIDVDSFVLKYVLEEFLAFKDAGRSSAYYYKDENGLLCAGPGWDFGGSFLGDSQIRNYMNLTDYSTEWFELLCKHEEFERRVVECYNRVLSPTIDEFLKNKFSDMQEEIASSAKMNEVRWQTQITTQSTTDIKKWILERKAFMDEHLNNKDFLTVTILCEWQNKAYLYVENNQIITEEQMPQYERAGFNLVGWCDSETGERYDFTKPITQDIVLTAMWEKKPVGALASLWQKLSQMIPELAFAALFGIVLLLYMTKIIRRRKRK